MENENDRNRFDGCEATEGRVHVTVAQSVPIQSSGTDVVNGHVANHARKVFA
jgi:hypothetical protein